MEEDLCVTGRIFGTRLVSTEKQAELRDRDAELQQLLERLQNLRPLARLPLVSTTCTCKPIWRPHEDEDKGRKGSVTSRVYDSEEDGESDNSDDDDGFTLEQVLHAISLYEKKPPTRRSPKTLRNLVCSYSGHQEATEDDVLKILGLTTAEDPGIGEAAFLLIRQLSMREDNAFRFLSRDGMKKALHVLQDVKLRHLHEVAAQVIGKMACHISLADHWLEHMMTDGLSIITSRISYRNSQNVRYACAQCLVPLATHFNMSLLILDQALDVINTIKEINTDFKEVYAELMTVLAQQTDYTRASILNINSLTEALDMLKRGPCASQNQALVFMATLAESDCGLKALLEAEAIHYILSCIEDSECRKVRCTALAALHNALASTQLTFQKQVLVSVDQFFHEHEDGYGLTAVLESGLMDQRPKFRLDTQSRVTRAIDDLCSMVLKLICKDARIGKDKKGKVSCVHLTPGIDIDPTLLKTLTHLTQVIIKIGHLKVIPVNVKGFDLDGVNKEEYEKIMKKSFGGSNPLIVRTMFDHGVTCLLDVLHTYVIRLHLVAKIQIIGDSSNNNNNIHNINSEVQTIQNAWALCSRPKNQNAVDSSDTYNGVIFTDAEQKLIRTLLDAVHMFAMCSCDNDLRDLEQDAKDKMEDEHGGKHNNRGSNHKCSEQANNDNGQQKQSNSVTFTRRNSASFWSDVDPEDTEDERNRISVHDTCECNRMGARSRPDSHLKEFMDNKATIQREAVGSCLDSGDEGEVFTEAGLLFKEQLNKTVHLQRRAIRVRLFEGGIIECIGPWLAYKDETIKGLALPILRCMIQPVTEFIEPRPVITNPPPTDLKTRPMSAMTQKERDRALNMALFQMSPGMNSVMRDALGIPPSPPSSPKKPGPTAQPPSSKIFTITESIQNRGCNGQGVSQSKECWSIQEEDNHYISTQSNCNGLNKGSCSNNGHTINGANDDVESVDGNELFYEDEDLNDNEQEDLMSALIKAGNRLEADSSADKSSSAKQCLTIPNEANKEQLLQRGQLLKTYAHGDYKQFARKPSSAGSSRPQSGRPQSGKLCMANGNAPNSNNMKQRPASAKVTLRARPDSAGKSRMLKQRPSSAKINRATGNKPSLPNSSDDRPSSATNQTFMTRAQSANGRLSMRSQRPNSARASDNNIPANANIASRPPHPPCHNNSRRPVTAHCGQSVSSSSTSSSTPPVGNLQLRNASSEPQLPLTSAISMETVASAPISFTGSAVSARTGSTRLSSARSTTSGMESPLGGGPSVVKLQVTASLRPGSSRRPMSIVGSSSAITPRTHERPTSASSSRPQKAIEEATRKMKQGQLPWKPTFDKCEPVRSQCCHRVVEVCGRLLIRDLLNRDVTTKRAAIVFLQEVIRLSETPVHMKLSECSLIPRLVDYLRVNDDNILEEVLGLVVARLLVKSDQRLKQLFSRCGGTELLMCMANSSASCAPLRTEAASTLKAITKTNGLPTGTVGLRRTMSAPAGRPLNHEQPDIWDKIMDRWKEEDKVSAMLRRNSTK